MSNPLQEGGVTESFSGNRLGNLRDLHTAEWEKAYGQLREYSGKYVSYLIASGILDQQPYTWPIDPLHNYTRLWEYPYVYHQLGKHVSAEGDGRSKVLDIGAALTFFPSFLAHQGYDSVASDYDPKWCELFDQLQTRASGNKPPGVGDVTYLNEDVTRLSTIPDESLDAALCISVLEHVPDHHSALDALHRVLRPGGVLILTFDLQMREKIPASYDEPLSPDAYRQLIQETHSRFESLEPEVSVHPMDILTYTNHPKELSNRAITRRRSLLQRIRPFGTFPLRLKSKVWQKLFKPDYFCVYGTTCRKPVDN